VRRDSFVQDLEATEVEILDEEIASRQTEVERKHSASTKAARDYFEAGDAAAEELGEAELYDQWRQTDDVNKDAFETANSRILTVLALKDLKREAARQNYDIERHLFAWGYIDAPKSPELIQQVALIRNTNDGVVPRRAMVIEQSLDELRQSLSRQPAGVR